MLKRSSQELLCQFQPNMAGNALGGWGFRLIFSMEYSWGKEIQVCLNKVSGVVIMTMPLTGTHFYISLYCKKLETSFFHESLVWMH